MNTKNSNNNDGCDYDQLVSSNNRKSFCEPSEYFFSDSNFN